MPFARYVKKHIFDPLGLTSTTYSYDVANANGRLADGITKQGVKLSENPLGNGTVRAMPFWSTIGGEDGNSKFVSCERVLTYLHRSYDRSHVWSWRYYKQCC